MILHTNESSTGKKIVAVLRFDVTSVKKPLIMIMEIIATGRDTPEMKLSACATLSDSLEVYNRRPLTVKIEWLSRFLLEKPTLVLGQRPR